MKVSLLSNTLVLILFSTILSSCGGGGAGHGRNGHPPHPAYQHHHKKHFRNGPPHHRKDHRGRPGNYLQGQRRQADERFLFGVIENVYRNLSSQTRRRVRSIFHKWGQSGLGAGDPGAYYGVWSQGTLGSATDSGLEVDGKTKISSKGESHAFIVGADTKINETTVVGVAFSHGENELTIKQKSIVTSKTEVTSNTLSVYGSNDLNNKLSLNGNISFGKIDMKNTYSTNQTVAQDKGSLIGGSLTANYKIYSKNNLDFTPRLGVAYNNISIKAPGPASEVNKSNLDVGAGMSAKTTYEFNKFTLSPTISADYTCTVWAKDDKQKVEDVNKLAPTFEKKISKNKGQVILGTGLTVSNDRLEVSGGYNYTIQGKRKAHIGYAKFRVNF